MTKVEKLSRLTGISIEDLRAEVIGSNGMPRKGALREALIRQWRYLPKTIANKFRKARILGRLEFEDAEQEGFFGLQRAAELYDPSKGWKFVTYAWPSVWDRIRKATREATIIRVPHHIFHSPHLTKKEHLEAAEKVAWVSQASTLPHEGINEVPDREPEEPEEDYRTPSLRRALHKLSVPQLELLYSYYWEEKTIRELAEEEGVVNQAVQQRLKTIRKKLKEAMS